MKQPDMKMAMTTYNPLAISLFTASWTVGMAAMMFPAITPMVMLYGAFVTNKEGMSTQGSVTVQAKSPSKIFSIRSFKVFLFIASYLMIWALTGIGLLLGWSVVMNSTLMANSNYQFLPVIYGALLLVAGAYQFTPLKAACIGYCESPMSFFMRRWKDGTIGAIRMGFWHGIYCLGCCWAYFLLMVALGWMNLLWMGLFAGVIFGEKMWKKGIWVARAAGAGLVIVGLLVIAGLLPALVPSGSQMEGNAVIGDKNDMITGNNAMNSMVLTSNGDSSGTSSQTANMTSDSNDGQGINGSTNSIETREVENDMKMQ